MVAPFPGDVITYTDMCVLEKAHLQRGMNFRLQGGMSVVLMSQNHNAPYADRIEDDGKTLIYEGHNAPLNVASEPHKVDQPEQNPGGGLTQNGLFHRAVRDYKEGHSESELVKVYEKMKAGLWVYNGVFKLVDAWQEDSEGRRVWKFRLELIEEDAFQNQGLRATLEPSRLIPAHVKQQVWKRDQGRCVRCGSTDNLHFDHIIPFSRGGSSLTVENIQILCLRHNLSKSDKIE